MNPAKGRDYGVRILEYRSFRPEVQEGEECGRGFVSLAPWPVSRI